ncbi:protein phosphatases PP1 regulatory subunit sds22 [Metarhizium album ARSEF 1941]|uniref:Protein phosphatases PP1 regulatory subunit sds22 n=1 Tax=Metarhizium album (strain ARSEF 1941) TaxID=1081103 RepID=A0A0B2WTU6_METAS|nr:protein phosphatases PP1 regulatory subunit sds22 [Metarhizium album ARSEF 1941]KHN96887.1 protein phosphatases PP1 regulatory subunit sds22 [Metarhizium album ARSEF 1941]
MSSAADNETDQSHHHIDIQDDRVAPREEGDAISGMRNSKGWDGKLRVPKAALLSNPEALSDPEYSDDGNVLRGEEIRADEDLLESESSDSEEIICSHSRIGSISSLRLDRFKNVARICLRQNSIQEIEGLAPLAATLKDLDLYDNLISHMHGMDELTNLVCLDLSFNKIKHIKNISHMIELKELFLVANKISRIEGLDTLQNLTSLELGSNRIRELRNLDNLQSLGELWVAKNKITELTGLGGLSNLRLLSIQSNRIRDLSPLREVPQLEELYIAHNALESLEGIEENTNLTTLDISNNQIRSLKGLEGLTRLEEVWASYNQIEDFVEVEKMLRDKENLTTVYFEGNPVQLRGPALYRNKIRLALPQVSQIDATFVRV